MASLFYNIKNDLATCAICSARILYYPLVFTWEI